MTTNTTSEQDWSNGFDENTRNPKPIDWAYWVGKMPSLTAAQATCLMYLLDPDQHKSLDTNNEVEQAAHKIKQLAEANGFGPASPREWLDWADANTIKVHPGFRNEVRRSPVAPPSPAPPGAPAQKNSTKQPRRNSITHVIELAQSKCRNPKDTDEVWAQMQVLAQDEHAPFLASTVKGLKYHKNGTDSYLTRDALNKRIHPDKRGRTSHQAPLTAA